MGKSLIIHGADFSANRVFMPVIVNSALTIQNTEMFIRSGGYSTFLMEAENNDKWVTGTSQIDNQEDYALNTLPYGHTKIKVTCPSNISISVGVSKLNSNGKYSTINYANWTSGGVIEYDYSQYADAEYYQINFDSSSVSINDITIEFL